VRTDPQALRNVLDVVYASPDQPVATAALLDALRRAVPCDVVTLLLVGHDGTLRGHDDYPTIAIGDEAAYADGYRAHLAGCPICADPGRHADVYGVAALSDLYARPDQHARTPGADYFRGYATNHAIQTTVMTRSRLVFCRSGRDFTDRDRLVLGLLRPHLDVAYHRTARPDSLTARQREVLDLAAGGRTNKEIAALLSLSPGTVRKHLENIYARLDAPNRAAAVHALTPAAWTANAP
jgi:DNA-binding CsgD family transcriptional regulator